MKNKIVFKNGKADISDTLLPGFLSKSRRPYEADDNDEHLPEILFITSYPPRQCGIATYSFDLVHALNAKFGNSFSIKICALEPENERHPYVEKVKYVIDPKDPTAYLRLSNSINDNDQIQLILIQHEFGFFDTCEEDLIQFIHALTKPVIIVFHTVLPSPNKTLKRNVQRIAASCKSVIAMTTNSMKILLSDYEVPEEKITIISHGTHLVSYLDKDMLKEKYGLKNKKVLSTFGLISSGKSIETTLDALPAIIKTNQDVMFLVIGKTHPSVLKQEQEKYRKFLEKKIAELKLKEYVKFINIYLTLPELLEYLQLTDIYLFTSKDPFQAVSGTFSYALSCGCAIISTPIPHAREVLGNDAGIIIDFENSQQLAGAVNRLLFDEQLRKNISLNASHKMASTAWENTAVAHALLFEKIIGNKISLQYSLPAFNLNHLKKLTTDFGMIQFSIINKPDIHSGYTLDDNARALIAMCRHYELTRDEKDIVYINIYFNFIKHCFRPEGYFLNYVNEKGIFTEQNNVTNLADANGRAIWALGYLISRSVLMPEKLISDAEAIMEKALCRVNAMYSTRAMAFSIKGLHYYNIEKKSPKIFLQIKVLADRLVQMYRHESEKGWEWFESYLTYANGILSEAMLCAYTETGEFIYKEIAQASFNFLLSHTFNEDGIKVISNKSWLHKGGERAHYGEQPIDVAYTIIALSRFYEVSKDNNYLHKMKTAFNWFLGNNHLHQIIYNPCTGGCCDGLEENHVNLNQGAESTVSYLMARLTVERYLGNQQELKSVHERTWELHAENQLA